MFFARLLRRHRPLLLPRRFPRPSPHRRPRRVSSSSSVSGSRIPPRRLRRSAGSSPQPPPLQSSSSTPHADPRAFSAAAAISASRPVATPTGALDPRTSTTRTTPVLAAVSSPAAFAFDAVFASLDFPTLRATISCRKLVPSAPGLSVTPAEETSSSFARESNPSSFSSLCQPFDEALAPPPPSRVPPRPSPRLRPPRGRPEGRARRASRLGERVQHLGRRRLDRLGPRPIPRTDFSSVEREATRTSSPPVSAYPGRDASGHPRMDNC